MNLPRSAFSAGTFVNAGRAGVASGAPREASTCLLIASECALFDQLHPAITVLAEGVLHRPGGT